MIPVTISPAPCPHCGADRAPGLECPRCGVIYAKARSPTVPPSPVPVEVAEPLPGGVGDARGALPGAEPTVWRGEVEAARSEVLVRAIAPPAALFLAWGLVSTGPGHALVRTFLSMWVHEIGHAVTAWWSGYGAFPGPWRTPVSESRMPLVVIALAGGLAALGWRGWRRRQPLLLVLAGAGLAAQLACTLLPPGTARAFITFGGDAGCLVLGAALVATLWTDPEGPLGRGWLRWGFLVIGACSLVDALDTWVRAGRDRALIPLGEIEGVGLSDASKLMELHGWTAGALTGRYVTLGLVCLAALGVGYAVALARARARLRDAEAAAAG